MTVPVKNKPSVIIPPAALRRPGFKSGQELEVRASFGVITILPKSPSTDDEYTPEERLAIDTRLAEARKGPYHGPFETADDAISLLHKEVKKRKAAKRKTTS